jgi:hypothetical protein
MDNQPKIGCRFGTGTGDRTKIIDPNAFYGETNSSRNIPVRIEDLTISVKLTTTKKSRTTIATSEDENTVVKEQKGATINFIEGSDINGKKVLTTKYTQLTTVFDKDEFNPETFGITNIDIDYNTSYTPVIKIDFVDVKGSSIFQNEESLTQDNSQNKYTTFFEFPYPMFELEVKGYYGQPVTYCLHMTKFNSKFNSQTGNFEISCEFIGYTYALLSDMLVGVLKVIHLTNIGGTIFNNYNTERTDKGKQPILNLVELRKKIADISEEIQKAAATSSESKDIVSFQESNNLLSSLNLNLANLNDQFSITKKDNTTETTEYSFVVMDNTPFSNEKNANYNAINAEIKETIKKYNDLKINGLSINENEFASPTIITELTLDKLEPDYDLQIGIYKDASEIESFKKDLKNYIKNNFNLASNVTFRAFDLRSRYKILEIQKSLSETSLKDANRALAIQIKDKVAVTLGFEPTVRNMVEIFTNLIEVFMETIWTVSNKAENNVIRKELLQTAFGQDLNKSDYTEKINYWPWPDYREKDSKTNAYVDTYLGSCPELKNNISDIDELVFIDDLLKAFLTANKQQKESDLLNAGDETLFIPTNPLDTKVFGVSGNPYAKKDIINTQQALRTVLVRAMTFLGYSNDQDYLTAGEDGEIQTMAKLEARMLYDALLNPTVKSLFNKIEQDNIKKTIGKISGSDRYVIGETTRGDYYYNYVNKEDGGLLNDFKLLPIGFDIEGEDLETAYQSEPFARTYIEQDKLREYASSGKIFLTNYGGGLNALGSDSVDNAKSNDGGIYIEIKQPSDIIPTTTESLYDTNLKTEMVLDLKALKEDSIASAGFNVFGGNYGISDYSNINFGEEFKTSQPKSMFIFYEQNSILNGLGLSRKASKNLKSDYDFNKTGNINLSNTYEERNIDIQSILETGKYKGSYAKPLHKDYGSNWSLSRNMDSSDVSYPFISQYLDISDGRRKTISLFGSKFYYFQKNNVINFYDNRQSSIAEKYVRGLLFLNTLPFKIYETGNVVNNPSGTVKNNKNNPFQVPEIRHLFDINAGFIHTPKLWVAYVGGLLWWLSEEDPKVSGTKIIGGGRGKTDPIIWRKDCGNDSGNWACKPTKNQYLPKMLMLDPEDIESDSILLNLPRQVQDKFKEVFFEFINGEGETSFTNIASKLEIYDGTGLGFCNLVNRFSQPDLPNTFIKKTNVSSNYVKGSDITDNFKNYDNYNVILPVYSDIGGAEYLSSIYLELKDDSDIVGKLKDIFKEELIIVNTGYKIWNPKKYAQYRQGVTIKKDVYGEYFKTFTEEIKALTEGTTIQGEEEKQLNEVFGMSNKNDIKLMLYKHCKNIYDKWVGGVQDINNVIFQCGDNSRTDSNRKQTDTALSDKYGSGKPRLIDSFRFVTRSFRDIGDELFIDPRPVEEQISDFPNTSSYSVISGLLNDNKFEFHSLPTFINYRDDEMLQSVFTPQEYGNSITSCGPTFVCVYTGQHSKSLDIKSGRYPNDGFDMRCNSTTIPDDFKNALQPYEDPVAVFEVNYSQQNQNIFKDITLDQSEFSETEESLKIVQDISMNGFENKPTYAGQNMYNIYGVRSYSAEIEMLGNPMIQPMMYFQLNNIPMFHGAYMIIRTRHNIKPNHMTTWFTGSRIRAIETPLFDVADAYMSLIETLDLSEVKGGSTTVRGNGNYINTYFSTLLNNKPKDTLIIGVELKNSKNLTKVAEEEFTIWKNGQLDEKDALTIIKKYTDKTPGITPSDASNNLQPWSAAFTSFIMLAGDSNFMKSTGHHTYVTDAMKGVNGYEVFPLNSGLKIKPEVGCLLCQTREGSYTASHCDVVYKIQNNKIFLIGGNVSDSVKVSEITLSDGYITNETNVKDYKLLVLKTNNKYYNNKDLAKEANLNKDGVSKNIIDSGKQIQPNLIYDQLKKQLGYPDEAIAGIMGNMYQESRFNPTAKNKTGGDYGLVQWYGDRQGPLFDFLNKNNLDATSYIDQIKFITNELNGNFKYTGKNLKTNKNVENSTKIFYVTYEGGSLGMINFSENSVDKRFKQLNVVDNSFSNRTSFANQFYTMIKNKKFNFPS